MTLPDPSASKPTDVERPATRQRSRLVVLVGVLVSILVWSQARGLVSSNDGAHVALARAFVRGELALGRDAALTLWVDHARRDGRDLSDRPPGTAALAIPAVALAGPLDRVLGARTRARLEVDPRLPPLAALVARPASDRFIETYGLRRRMTPAPTTDLIDLQGTAIVLGLHTVLLGALGLVLADRLLVRRGVSEAGRAFALLALGLATLWGPYATTLFAHATSGVLLALTVLACECARAGPPERARAWALTAGVAGAWTVACDHALVLAVVPTVILVGAPRHLGFVALGAAPVVLAVLLYDAAAFGSPWHVGYDFQSNFAFARTRAQTFGGDPWQGLWTLVGWGRGAGLLAQAPVVFVGLAALSLGRERRWLLSLLPWFVVLVFHRTPWGGATEDHRYLVPALPLVAVGLGLAWDRSGARSRLLALGMVALAAVSAVLVWTHFWQWRG